MEPLSPASLFLLWLAGLFAGFVDSIAGGGGIISLPALLATGMPPHLALGTNKLQGTCGSMTSAFNYTRKGLVNLHEIPTGVIFTAIGALTGTVTVQVLSPDFLRHIILFLLLAVFLYTLFSPDLGKIDRNPSVATPVFYGCGGMVLGFYDGFFGPGTGSFWTIALVMILGLGFFFLALLIINTVISVLVAYFEIDGGVRILGLVASFGVLMLIIALTYKYAPDVTITWGDVWIGSILTAILLTLGIWGLGLYLTYSSVGSAYGAAGRVVTLLSHDTVVASGSVAKVDEYACVSCGACITACTYDAIQFHDTKKGKKAIVNPILCKGDGLCNAKCPTNAIVLKHFTNDALCGQIDAAVTAEDIMEQMDAVLEEA